MTETAKTETGIRQDAEPCWELFNPQAGRPVELSDFTPHFTSKAEAEETMESLDDEDHPVESRQLPSPCFTATAQCGLPFELDSGGTAHWPTFEDARREVLDCDWKVIGGVLRCEDQEACTAEVKP